MKFNQPEVLYLILPLSALWLALAWHARTQRRKTAELFIARPLWPRLMPAPSTARFWLKTALWELALVFSLFALAGPRFGVYAEIVRARGADLYVLLDVSRSMLATDVPPSRLERAKADVADLLNHLHGERMGLIAFAGAATIKCPLTTDYNYFRQTLKGLDTHSASKGGTAIGDAIRKALEVLPPSAERDQSLLLITDGDDQDSYPLEAAGVAAERKVMIFTVGLGDTEKGSRIPSGKDGAQNYIEYQGQQVWSKMDGTLLSQIAVKTNGAYVPAGTQNYDLGELYDSRLQALRAGGQEHTHERQAEQYQLFLALALCCLLLELLVKPHPPAPPQPRPAPLNKQGSRPKRTAAIVSLLLLALCQRGAPAAEDPGTLVRDGLRLYSQEKFDEARGKFAQADKEAQKSNSPNAAIAAFDLACAYHRKGDTEKARDNYLKAGDAHDRAIAAAAHFNLGCLEAEAARALAGEKPVEVAPEKRKEIVQKLMKSVDGFRHCLGLQPEHAAARKNIELIKQWIKYYADKWHEYDRQKMRKESNLLQFLEYLIQSQLALRESVKELKPTASLDIFAELKQAQDELAEEIEPLQDKIKTDLTPPPQPQAGAQPAPAQDQKELERGVKILQGWAAAAGQKMRSASERLSGREPVLAAEDQQQAGRELEKIWQALAPFNVLLARDLADQTGIVQTLKPESADASPGNEAETSSSKNKKWEGSLYDQLTESGKKDGQTAAAPPKPASPKAPQPAEPALNEDDCAELAQLQQETAERTALLKLKAEAELKRLAETPAQPAPPQPAPPGPNGAAPDDKTKNQPQALDPEKLKAGYQKAVELAPPAAEKMIAASRALRAKKPDVARPDAEEAKRLLEEIEKAQPKQENQNKKDPDKKDHDKNKKEQDKKDQQQQEEKKKDEKQQAEKQKEELSQEQLQDLLRRVREREKIKQDRERELRAKIGGAQVEKDW